MGAARRRCWTSRPGLRTGRARGIWDRRWAQRVAAEQVREAAGTEGRTGGCGTSEGGGVCGRHRVAMGREVGVNRCIGRTLGERGRRWMQGHAQGSCNVGARRCTARLQARQGDNKTSTSQPANRPTPDQLAQPLPSCNCPRPPTCQGMALLQGAMWQRQKQPQQSRCILSHDHRWSLRVRRCTPLRTGELEVSARL